MQVKSSNYSHTWMMNLPLIDDSPKTPTKSPCFADKISPATTLKVAQKIPNLQNTILNIEFLHDSNSNECTRKHEHSLAGGSPRASL